MLRLKANKTSLYKLVGKFEDLPPMRWVTIAKAYRAPDGLALGGGRIVSTITNLDVDHFVNGTQIGPSIDAGNSIHCSSSFAYAFAPTNSAICRNTSISALKKSWFQGQ